MTDPKEIARMFKVLSVDTRVQIIRLLGQHPLCVGALANLLGITPGAVSQHLRILRDAGLVEAERRGYYIHYILNRRSIGEWRGMIDEMFSKASRKKQICEIKEGGKQCVKKSRNANTRKD
jgi:DNA-binding transcriptional ArsR family regulator